MLLGASPRLSNQQIVPKQFTPAFQKLLNRVIARVYRGNTKKKFSRNSSLMEMQHEQIFRTTVSSSHSNTYRKSTSLSQKRLSVPRNTKSKTHNTVDSLGIFSTLPRPDDRKTLHDRRNLTLRCQTDASYPENTSLYNKISEYNQNLITKTYMFQESDMPDKSKNTKQRQMYKSSYNCKQYNNDKFMTQSNRECEGGFGSKIKQFQNRRRVNNFMKTQQKMRIELQHGFQREKEHIDAWETDQKDDVLF